MLLPAVGRASTTDRTNVSIFAAGLVCGGLISANAVWLGSGIGALIPSPIVAATLALAGTVAVLRDARVVQFPLPEARRLVPEAVLRKGRVVGIFQFGLEMGTGARTFVTSTLPYVLVLALILTHPPYSAAMAAGIGFGLGRAAMLLSRTLSHDGEGWDNRLAAAAPWLIPGSALMGAAIAVWIAAIGT